MSDIREKPWFPVVYMFVVTAAFSSVLIAFSRVTRERVEANQQLAFEKAVLEALSVQIPEGTSRLELHRMYQEWIKPPDARSAGAYRLIRDGRLIAYALPVDGQGFWAPIKGVIGLDTDLQTITGIAFYEQNETPGLGAEIVTMDFRRQFEGKKLSATGRAIRILPKTEQLGESDVHAVTGATQTSVRLERLINDDLNRWREQIRERTRTR